MYLLAKACTVDKAGRGCGQWAMTHIVYNGGHAERGTSHDRPVDKNVNVAESNLPKKRHFVLLGTPSALLFVAAVAPSVGQTTVMMARYR